MRKWITRALVVMTGVVLVLLVGLRLNVTAMDNVLPPDARPGWYVLDQGRPGCSASRRGWLGQQVLEFPPDGYLCTSSPPSTGLHYWRYFIRTPEGDLQELETGIEIVARTTIGPTEGAVYSFDGGMAKEGCRVDGEAFYFRRGAEPIEGGYGNVLARHRPECAFE